MKVTIMLKILKLIFKMVKNDILNNKKEKLNCWKLI